MNFIRKNFKQRKNKWNACRDNYKCKKNFKTKLKNYQIKDYINQEEPFKNSCLSLYKWAPIAEELKVLDKEIVLNSMKK